MAVFQDSLDKLVVLHQDVAILSFIGAKDDGGSGGGGDDWSYRICRAPVKSVWDRVLVENLKGQDHAT